MITYIKLKQWYKYHKTEVVFGVCLVTMFFVGFGTGRIVPNKNSNLNPPQYQNYTTKPGEKEAEANHTQTAETSDKQNADQSANNNNTNDTLKNSGDCIVKGNISSKSKIYHVKGGAFYDRTSPEQCFKTEDEAKADGFRKSNR